VCQHIKDGRLIADLYYRCANLYGRPPVKDGSTVGMFTAWGIGVAHLWGGFD